MDRIVVRHRSGSTAGRIQEFEVRPGMALTIGRDPASDISLHPYDDSVVSRQHARIIVHANRVIWLELIDGDSRNGTFLNERWIRGRVGLVPGDRIRLGWDGPELELDLESPTPGPPAA